MINFKAPKFKEETFTCPYCNTYAQQNWSLGSIVRRSGQANIGGGGRIIGEISVSTCKACNQFHLWYGDKMLIPSTVLVDMPNPDMPTKVKDLYNEARDVYSISSKAAAALLRLALQLLCIELGGNGKNINTDIGELVKKGLNPQVQKALDTVRITGNNAVHPGELDLEDKPELVTRLFKLLNFIVTHTITIPNEIKIFFEEMPDGAKQGIENRDK